MTAIVKKIKVGLSQEEIDDLKPSVIDLGTISSSFQSSVCEDLDGLTETGMYTFKYGNTRYMMNEVLSQTENPCGAGNLQIGFTAEVDEALKGLRTFMFDNIYKGDVCAMERERAALVVHYLFDHYLSDAEQMPELYQKIAEEEGIRQGVCDYISGMSDAYCIALFKEITIPRSFIQTL